MIILDTNVISETARPLPNTAVLGFLDELDRTTTYITAITAAELLRGVMLLPDGKRKAGIVHSVRDILDVHFDGRILPFDAAAAARMASETTRAEKEGKTVPFADSMIAGIALAHGALLATRDTTPFEVMGVKVVDPWAL